MDAFDPGGAIGGAGLPPSYPQGGQSELPAPAGGAPSPQAPMEGPLHAKLRRWSDPNQSANLCFEILERPGGEELLNRIGYTCRREYDIDEQSRSAWLQGYERSLKLATQVADAKTAPWVGASNVVYPLISSAALQFHARAYPAIVASPDVVKGVVVGPDTGKPKIDPQTGQPAQDPKTGQPVWEVEPGTKRARADRVSEHMSWQLLDEQPEWEEETDRLLMLLPIVGCVFRKVFFDPIEGRNCAIMVSAKDLCINVKARSMFSAPRLSEVTQLYPVEIAELERARTFLPHEYGASEGDVADVDAPREFIEQHRRWDLDDDGYPEPYIVTFHKLTNKVARIVARFDFEGVKWRGDKVLKIDAVAMYQKYDFLPNPDGIYGRGFGQLLGPINDSINSCLNQMFDAGTLQNTGGGFIGKGLSMHGGSLRFKQGEWKTVNAPGGAIRDAIVPLKFSGPSPVLFQLLGVLMQAGKELGAHAEVLTGNQSKGNVPAATTLALIEQGLKVYTAIYKRVYRALEGELDMLFRLNRLYLEDQAEYRRFDEWKQVTREDYAEGAGVEPISDPSMTTEMQKLARAEFLRPFATDPFCDPIAIRHRIFNAAHIDKPEELIRKQPLPNPQFVLKAAELANKLVGIKAKSIMEMARGVQALADAELSVAQAGGERAAAYLGFLEHELNKMKLQVDQMGEGEEKGEPAYPGTAPPPSAPSPAPAAGPAAGPIGGP